VGFMISVNIIKVLGEGGFSFVYLAQDEASGVRDPYELPPRHHSHV
jgi:serine/threonine protein kinase